MTSSRDEGIEKEPVMCSKCNEVFETDSKYIYTTIMKNTKLKKKSRHKNREQALYI